MSGLRRCGPSARVVARVVRQAAQGLVVGPVTEELIQAGVPKEDIVLGFHEPEIRPYTGFAVA